MRMRRRRLPTSATCVTALGMNHIISGSCVMCNGELVPGVWAAGDSGWHAMKLDNLTFYGYIRVLLIKPNSMVYLCYVCKI